MKRSLIILFSFFYFVSSSGVFINLHYCRGKLKSVGIFRFSEANCCGKKMKSKGCCSDKSSLIKTTDKQASVAKIILAKQTNSSLVSNCEYVQIYISPIRKLAPIVRIKPPPELYLSRVFLTNRSIRI